MKILLALLIVSCLVVSFGFQANALLQQSPQTKVTNYFDGRVFIQEDDAMVNGGGEVPGPGVPR